ncbi:hypothetical protein [[Mycoplasma] cavipharyngis]|uniref:hypothetical protein n=1 Tax=[Mycoplasma] cavipharyngis TaxID=92757 RepID=UPI003703D00E
MFISSLVFGIIIFKFKNNVIEDYKKFSLKKLGVDFNKYLITNNHRQLESIWEKVNHSSFLSFFCKKIFFFSWIDIQFQELKDLVEVDSNLSKKFASLIETRWNINPKSIEEHKDYFVLHIFALRLVNFLWIFCSSYSVYFINKYNDINKNSIKLHQAIFVLHWIISWTATILLMIFFYWSFIYYPSERINHYAILVVVIFLGFNALRNILLSLFYHLFLKIKKKNN